MGQVNISILEGNLTSDVEVKVIGNDKKVANFTIANNDEYIKDGEKVKKTTYVDVTVWGAQAASVAEHRKKGDLVIVEGKLDLNQWEDKDGGKHQKLKIVADRVNFR